MMRHLRGILSRKDVSDVELALEANRHGKARGESVSAELGAARGTPGAGDVCGYHDE
jgi:hypothetical protein